MHRVWWKLYNILDGVTEVITDEEAWEVIYGKHFHKSSCRLIDTVDSSLVTTARTSGGLLFSSITPIPSLIQLMTASDVRQSVW